MRKRSCRRPRNSPISRAAASTCRCCPSCRSIADGCVNVSKLGLRPHVTAGAGGFVDITARAKRIVFSGYFTAGAALEIQDGRLRIGAKARSRNLSKPSSRSLLGPPCCSAGAGDCLCHRALRDAARAAGLTVLEIAPGVNLERDVLAQSEFPLLVSPQLQNDGRELVPSRADQAAAASGNGGGAMSSVCPTLIRRPVGAIDAKAWRQAQCARSGHDPRAC